jgi:TetR/AcrR family transcriptional regulator
MPNAPAARPSTRHPRASGRRRNQPAGQTREAILAAARHEFAARGYAGARVDRIAAAARVNKAMIYYHFASKEGLYHAMLREIFEPAGDEARAILAADIVPEAKLDAIVATISARLHAHRELPSIMMREVAEGARHLDPGMLRAMSVLFQSVASVVAEGQQDGRFEAVNPLLVYFTLVGPLVFFLGSSPVRAAMARLLREGEWDCSEQELRRHLQRVLRRTLLRDPRLRAAPDAAAGAARRHR